MAENDSQKIEEVKLEDFGSGSTEERVAALERALSTILRKTTDVRGVLHFQSFSSNPTVANEGDVAVVGGKLKIYTSGAWTVVGTQT